MIYINALRFETDQTHARRKLWPYRRENRARTRKIDAVELLAGWRHWAHGFGFDGATGIMVVARCCLGAGGARWLGRVGRHGGVRGWREVLGGVAKGAAAASLR